MKSLALALFLLPSLCFAEIIQIENLSEVLKYDEPGTVYFFDIDNTLLETAQVLGSDQWFRYLINKYIQSGIPADRAGVYAVEAWERVLKKTKVKPVEENTASVITALQGRQRLMAALTARESDLEEVSRKQLLSADIDFEKTSLAKNETVPDGVLTALYDGVIHMGHGGNKGETAVQLLNEHRIVPSQIIFVDDRQPNVDQFEEAMAKYATLHPGLKFKSLRYGYLDKVVAAFNPEVAEREWAYFQQTGRLKNFSESCSKISTLKRASNQ